MQDNNPKHTSVHASDFITSNNINWWKTPAESPDLSPIENMWHELKEFIRREVKPTTKQQLIEGILAFWETVTVEKCNKFLLSLTVLLCWRWTRFHIRLFIFFQPLHLLQLF